MTQKWKEKETFVQFILNQRERRARGERDVYAVTDRDTGEGNLPKGEKTPVKLDLACAQKDIETSDCPELWWIHKFQDRDGDLVVTEGGEELVKKRRAWMGMYKGKMGRKIRLTFHIKYSDGLSCRVGMEEFFNGVLIRKEP